MTTDNSSLHPTDSVLGSFPESWVVQRVSGDPQQSDALIVPLHNATVNVTATKITAVDGDFDWSWLLQVRLPHAGPRTGKLPGGIGEHGLHRGGRRFACAS